MFLRRVGTGLFVLLVAVAGAGCKKQAAPVDQQPIAASNKNSAIVPNQNSKIEIQKSQAPLLRVHWRGKKRLATETNAAYFMTIWSLPESGRLEAQTLDKLALWLANARPALSNYQDITNYAALVSSNATASTLRPLVEDLLQEEWLLEVKKPTNQPAELALAIRLDDERNAAWQATQSTIGEAINRLRHTNCALTVTRSGAWTLLGVTGSPGTNSQLSTFSSQLVANGNPFPEHATNYWLEANVDLQRIRELLGERASAPPKLSEGGSSQAQSVETTNSTAKTGFAGTVALPKDFALPTISLTVIGDGENVRTRARLDFPQPLNLELDPWNVPTNLIHDPLIGFTAVRGIRPLLKNFKPWNDLQLGTPPNQAYFWAQNGAPWLHFVALPSTEARNQINKMADFGLNHLNPVFEANPIKVGEFERVPTSQGLGWRGLPLISPTFDCVGAGSQTFVFAGFYPNRLTNQPMPALLLPQFYGVTNMVYYDWEFTGPGLRGLTPISQLVRRLFRLPRLPAQPSISWLSATPPKLGNSATSITLANPAQLLLIRKSSLGFTAVELELITDWLQSPTFPCGLYTFTSPASAANEALPPGA